MRRITTGDVIAALALILALPAFIDFATRKLTVPEIEILPPAKVDFRTSELVIKKNDEGIALGHRDGGPAIDESTSGLQTYTIMPLSYINQGDSGEDFLISTETVEVRVGTTTLVYDAAYETEIVPRMLGSWIGDTSPRLPGVLEGGRARSDEVVFVPTSGDGQTWKEFLAALSGTKGGEITVVLKVHTVSGNSYSSQPCKVSIEELLAPVRTAVKDRSRHYRMTSKCARE